MLWSLHAGGYKGYEAETHPPPMTMTRGTPAAKAWPYTMLLRRNSPARVRASLRHTVTVRACSASTDAVTTEDLVSLYRIPYTVCLDMLLKPCSNIAKRGSLSRLA